MTRVIITLIVIALANVEEMYNLFLRGGPEMDHVPGKKHDMWNLEKENGDHLPEVNGVVGLREVMQKRTIKGV